MAQSLPPFHENKDPDPLLVSPVLITKREELWDEVSKKNILLSGGHLIYGPLEADLSPMQSAWVEIQIELGRRNGMLIVPSRMLLHRIGSNAQKGRELWRRSPNYKVRKWVIVWTRDAETNDWGYGLRSLRDPLWTTFTAEIQL